MLTLPPFGISITSLWTMSAWFLLPVVLLAPPEVEIPRPAAIRVALIVLAITVACLFAAPALAWYRHVNEGKEARAYYRAVSAEVTRVWRRTTGRPLTIVAGDQDLSAAVTFYSPDHPDSVPGFDLAEAPWVTRERLAREGFAAVCPAENRTCIETAGHHAPAKAIRVAYEASNTLLGVPSAPGRFMFVLIPPR